MADSLLISKKDRKESYWITYIKSRPKKNKNFLGFIGGQTGSGKSWAGISICSQIDKDFDESRVVFSMKSLMKLIKSGKLKRGSCILWDEAGVDINNRNWQSLTNKMINFLLQTFRHKNFILIFTSPYMDFIDASTRKLFHAEFLTQSINLKDSTCKIKPYLIQYNSRKQKFYYKHLRVAIQNKGVLPIKTWNVKKPNPKLIKAYERIKEEFTSELNADIEKSLYQMDNKEDDGIETRKELTTRQSECLDLYHKHNNIKDVADELDISPTAVSSHLKLAYKKGYKRHKPPQKPIK